uniref:Major facilitator superfamily (MFS) profile domain-containing protein n=1 Tax=Meloidogyne incognita TaxID=6306 RepID=A0A914LFP4_MELIC
MGDKAILTEVLEASKLTDTYSSLTASNIIDQLKEIKSGSSHSTTSVHYEGLDGSNSQGGGDTNNVNVNIERQNNQKKEVTTNGVPDVYTVDDAVEFLGFGRFQILLAFLTGLAWMADAMEIMILSILSPSLYCEWAITPMQQALITTCVFSGMMLSSTAWGKFCDRFGRRKGLLSAALLTFAMGVLSSAAPNFHLFLALRGLTGVGIGGIPQAVTLFAEFLPLAQRAKCVVFIESFWAIGASFEAILAFFVMSAGWGWRWLLLLSSLPLALFSISCLWLPESARYLVAAGRPDLAISSLQRIAKLNGRSLPPGRLIEGNKATINGRGKLFDLFSPTLAGTTFRLWILWTVNAFCYYGIVLLTTVLFQSGDECHGGISKQINNSLVTETPIILECKPLLKKDYIDLISTTFSEFPGLILTAILIEWLGRKRTMAMEFGVFALFSFLLIFCVKRYWLTTFIFISRAFISGAFQCVYVYTPEVYPTTLRALGLGASSSMARLGAIVTPFIAQVASGDSLLIPIITYSCASLIGLVTALSLPIETKGRQMMETH